MTEAAPAPDGGQYVTHHEAIAVHTLGPVVAATVAAGNDLSENAHSAHALLSDAVKHVS